MCNKSIGSSFFHSLSVCSMMVTKLVEKFSKLIEWSLFGFLCGVSIFFIWGVIDHYFSGISSFAQSEQPVTELPTIVYCFLRGRGSGEYVDLQYGTEFTIEYKLSDYWGSKAVILKEGTNVTISLQHHHRNPQHNYETVFLEKLITLHLGTCYKVTTMSDVITIGSVRSMIFHINETAEEPAILKTFITSEENAYGIAQNVWMDGKVSRVSVLRYFYVETSLKPLQRKYLKSNSECSEIPFYECFSSLLSAILEECQTKCNVFSLPSLPICKSEDERKCLNGKSFDLLGYIFENGLCEKHCKSTEYHSDIVYDGTIDNYFENGTVGFGYRFATPETVTVYNEYLIYDTTNMIGSIGGTLGMFIGFSFMKIMSSMINILKRFFKFVESKYANHQHSKLSHPTKDKFEKVENIKRKSNNKNNTNNDKPVVVTNFDNLPTIEKETKVLNEMHKE